MSMENPLNDKGVWRSLLKKKRSALPKARRESASLESVKSLLPLLSSYPLILSFWSFGDEIPLERLNAQLASLGKLVLPKVAGETLELYHVRSLEDDLVSHPFGFLEPNPIKAKRVDPSDLRIALIPGLGFDERGHRLGFGNGYYDRLLKRMPKCSTIGVGFLEQKVSLLPSFSTDVALSQTSFF